MWQVKSLKADNIQTFKKLDYEINQGVTTLIFGVNNDNAIQLSNGSGKSGILEILTVGLRGAPLRPVRIDEVINDEESKGYVEIELFNNETDELLRISRILYKKSSNVVSLYMERGGKPVDKNEYTQSSVAEYNSFIFDKLGITEEELLNNFILSKHRYVSFLDASDRDKKEMINKLSNAVIIDPAIERLSNDVKLKEDEDEELSLLLSSNSGSIEVLNNQIEKMKTENASISKEKKIKEIELELAEINDSVYVIKSKLKNNETELADLQKSEDAIAVSFENKDLYKIDEELKSKREVHSDNIKVSEVIDQSRRLLIDGLDELDELNEESIKAIELKEKIEDEILSIKNKYNEVNKKSDDLKDKIQKTKDKNKEVSEELNNKYIELLEKHKKINEESWEINKKIGIFEDDVRQLNGIVAGKITCPKCEYEFLLDEEMSLEVALKKLQEKQKEIDALMEEKSATNRKKNKYAKSVQKSEEDIANNKLELNKELLVLDSMFTPIQNELREIGDNLSKKEDSILDIRRKLGQIEKKIENVTSDSIDRIEEYLDFIFNENKNEKTKLNRDLRFAEQSIVQLNEGIKQINESNVSDTIMGLELELNKYLEKQKELHNQKDDIKIEINQLKQQENIFSDFKTHLANTKIEALNAEINSFLESFGTDISVKLSGYSKTKSGKIRDRISVSVLRNGIDFGSFAKMSEGEKSTVYLATILAHQKLINMSAPSTKGLDLLVIDEILDTVDEGGLIQMLNTIGDKGITSLIVSHGRVAENHPYTLVVTKENGVSEI